MCKKEGHMGRLPTVGLVQRGAQLPEPDIFRMALRKRSSGNRDRCGGKFRHPYALCPPHVTSSCLPISPVVGIPISLRDKRVDAAWMTAPRETIPTWTCNAL